MISQRIDQKEMVKAKALIDSAERITVVCHTAPDGDAIGSSLAAYHVLSAFGKEVHVVVPDAFLTNLHSLPGAKEIVDAAKYYDFACRLLTDTDLVLCLDFNEFKRTGRLTDVLAASQAPKILVDHHLHPNIEAQAIISRPEMAATAYLMFRFFCRLGLFNFIDRNAAECLLAGIMTDTGNLAYNCNDPEIYIVIAELIKKGADKEGLYNKLFNTFSANCMRLNSYAILKKMEVSEENHAALITLSREELNRYHYVKGDTEGLVNKPLAIPGVVYSVFMRQESDMVKVSMRSIGDFPVNILCKELFNGGGHLNAAGGEFYGTLEDAAALLRQSMEGYRQRFIDNNTNDK